MTLFVWKTTPQIKIRMIIYNNTWLNFHCNNNWNVFRPNSRLLYYELKREHKSWMPLLSLFQNIKHIKSPALDKARLNCTTSLRQTAHSVNPRNARTPWQIPRCLADQHEVFSHLNQYIKYHWMLKLLWRQITHLKNCTTTKLIVSAQITHGINYIIWLQNTKLTKTTQLRGTTNFVRKIIVELNYQMCFYFFYISLKCTLEKNKMQQKRKTELFKTQKTKRSVYKALTSQRCSKKHQRITQTSFANEDPTQTKKCFNCLNIKWSPQVYSI